MVIFYGLSANFLIPCSPYLRPTVAPQKWPGAFALLWYSRISQNPKQTAANDASWTCFFSQWPEAKSPGSYVTSQQLFKVLQSL